jgi:glycosyltransferase involved in cell wall biosynthesis
MQILPRNASGPPLFGSLIPALIIKFVKHNKIQRSRRLAFIANQAFSISNFRGPLVREMVGRGLTVYALAPDYDDASRAVVASLGAVPIDSSMSRTGMNPLRDILDIFRLAIQLRRLQLDATFAYFIKPVIYGTIAARLAAVPKRFAMIEGAGYVFTDDDKPSMCRRLLRAFVTQLYRLSLAQANRIFMLNPDDKELFVNECMVPDEKAQLLDGIGLDLNHYQVVEPILQPICFILVARLLREKGIYDYIEAARRIKSLHPSVRFLLLGSIDLNPGSVSESEVQSWVAEGVVTWTRQVADVRTWIAQASIFVLPSYREGLPRSTQEAMAMGRPVITTDVPGCRETVEEGVNGFMVPSRDPSALVHAMLTFIQQPEIIAPMGAESRRLAEKKFDVHKINAKILAAMEI